MRVISGSAKGYRLLEFEGRRTRPMPDRVKLALFNILEKWMPARNVLDLFAGTGSLGIEALSRGAERGVFVESDFGAARLIERNLEKTRLQEQASVLRTNAWSVAPLLAAQATTFDLVFVDPPYAMTAGDDQRRIVQLLDEIVATRLIEPQSPLMLRYEKGCDIASAISSMEAVDTRTYGTTEFTLFVLPEG